MMDDRRIGLVSDCVNRPGHTLRCYAPMAECTKAPAIHQNSIFQHVGSFAPDGGISQLFIVRFWNGFQHDNEHLMSFLMICDSNFSVRYI